MANPPPENLEQYNRVLEDLLSEKGKAGYPLPRLVHEKGFFDSILDQIKQWFDRQTRFSTHDHSLDIAGFFWVLKWVLIFSICVALLLLLFFLIRHFLQRKSPLLKIKEERREKGASFSDLESVMEKKIKAALEGKDFALAGRLRWKLFLKRSNQKLSLTPWEFDRKEGVSPSPAPTLSISPYPLMFGKRDHAQEDYRILETSLLELEKVSISHAA